MSSFETALKFTLRWEGGYVNHPADPGGATNKGVTQSVYDSYRRSKGLSPQSVRYITDAEVREIYIERFWKAAKCDRMEPPLAVAHFDTAVNFGVSGAIQFLQDALLVAADGIWGPVTESAFLKYSGNHYWLARLICVLRREYRYIRVRQSPSQAVFLQGWLNRDRDLEKYINGLRLRD